LTSLKNWIAELKILAFGLAAATLTAWDFFLAVAVFIAGATLSPPVAEAAFLPDLAIAAWLPADLAGPVLFFFFFLLADVFLRCNRPMLLLKVEISKHQRL
jgi:hypothetical protein